MDSDDDEPVCKPEVCTPVDFMAVFEPLQAYLNLGELTRLSMMNRQFHTETEAFVGWKQRALALGCKRKFEYSRSSVIGHIHKTKSRCCECGGKGARRYGTRNFRICTACAHDDNGFRQLVGRRDIQRSFGFTPYKTLKFTRYIKHVHGGNGLHPYLYWGVEVNRVYRARFE